MPCAACGGCQGVCAHHLKTKGAGGDDVISNLVPLCVHCHSLIHQWGEYVMKIKYPGLDVYLEKIREK